MDRRALGPPTPLYTGGGGGGVEKPEGPSAPSTHYRGSDRKARLHQNKDLKVNARKEVEAR